MAPINVMTYLGEEWVPRSIKKRRRWSMETMRRHGTPVVVKHMFQDADVKAGLARPSPSYDDVYGQVRHDDILSYGIGFVGLEDSTNEWYNTSTNALVVSETIPSGTGWIKAPYHRGFGPGYLTYIIEPDVAEDVFKVIREGVLTRVQRATVQAPWFPEINDNDLLINVTLDRSGNIVATNERFQAMQTNPVSMRGYQRLGRRENTEDGGNRFMIGQNFEMTLVPETDILYQVPVDR